jgi:hypothetical protein
MKRGQLDLTHGEFDPDGAASHPARFAIESTGLHFPDIMPPRLDPCVRWWQEVDPIEQRLSAVSLLRDARDRLFSIALWRDGAEQRSHVALVAEQVTALSGWDARHAVTFSGAIAGARAVFALDRRSTQPILLQRLPEADSCRTFLAWDARAGHALHAIEQAPDTWVLRGARDYGAVRLAAGEHAVGLAVQPGDEHPALVVLSPDRCDLWLMRADARTHEFRAGSAITRVAVHPVLPLLACAAGSDMTLLSL